MNPTRRVALFAAAAALSGCGFRPLYGPLAKGGGTVDPELGAIFVSVVPERFGQLLRQALQQRLEGAGNGEQKRYELVPAIVALETQTLGIQQDSSSSRVRLNARATWTLRTLAVVPTPLSSGEARALDGFDVNNQQFFASDLETSSAYRRLMDNLADKITQDLAIYFRQRAESA